MAAQECATVFQSGHSQACGNMQQAPTAGTEFGPFEDIGRVAIAEMVVTKTPRHLIQEGFFPCEININVPIFKDDGICEALPSRSSAMKLPEVSYLYLIVAMFLLLQLTLLVGWGASY